MDCQRKKERRKKEGPMERRTASLISAAQHLQGNAEAIHQNHAQVAVMHDQTARKIKAGCNYEHSPSLRHNLNTEHDTTDDRDCSFSRTLKKQHLGMC